MVGSDSTDQILPQNFFSFFFFKNAVTESCAMVASDPSYC